VDVRERMVVDATPISTDAFAMWTERLAGAIVETGASFFEATTAIAFADFAARGVDLAVVEVGLGGRLDATNVLQPLVSVVTHIALDHIEYLGNSLADIAREKAGVAKAGVPFVVGEPDPALAELLAEHGRAAGALPALVPSAARYPGPLALRGAHQQRNAAVAQVVLESLPPAWRPTPQQMAAGFASASLPGRFDVRGRWIFDVAHNPDSFGTLVDSLEFYRPRRPIHGVVGILGDKDFRTMLAQLSRAVDRLWLTEPPSAPPERRWNPLDALPHAGPAAVVERSLPEALAAAQRGAGTVLVTGSFHTVGDAMAVLPGLKPMG